MKKIFKLQNLDCANCAAKMEAAIQKIDGVETASVNFMTQKLTLTAPDDALERVLEDAVRLMKKIEPDCTVIR
ncbi:MAG: cation transporter [Clostridia bacterium]